MFSKNGLMAVKKITALMLVLIVASPIVAGHGGSHQDGSGGKESVKSFAGIEYNDLDVAVVVLLNVFIYGLFFYCVFFFNPEETSREE